MKIRPGDCVSVHYCCSLPNGFVLDATTEGTPCCLVAGSDDILPGFDAALMGHGPGDVFTMYIPATQAFGSSQPERIAQTSRSQLPANITPQPGTVLRVPHNEHASLATIVACDGDTITIDFNHPLSDYDLVFHITIIDVRRPADVPAT